MAKLELPEETKKRMEAATADLLIAIPAAVNVETMRAAASDAVLRISAMMASGEERSLSGLRAAVAYPGAATGTENSTDPSLVLDPAGTGGEVRFLPFPPPGDQPVIPSLGGMAAYQTLFAMARDLGISACVVVAPDLAALNADQLTTLMRPVLEGRCDLVMPLYPIAKLEGLLNSAILAPLTRALYGRRVRFPLAPDMAISARLLAELEQPVQKLLSQGRTLFWAATEAALRDRSICQVNLGLHHPAAVDGLDLSTVLTQTVGPLFAEMEGNAAFWQRVRGSQPVPASGTPAPPLPDTSAVDVRPMLETFALGSRNLQEMWSMVLPPVTLLELKRMTRQSADQFRMSDELWVHIVYDFALAYRLRTLSRTHLLGALTPLYLGWVASYLLEVSKMRPHEAEQRIEKLARAYEEGKPYLLSRWRWPDRFNP